MEVPPAPVHVPIRPCFKAERTILSSWGSSLAQAREAWRPTSDHPAQG